MWLKSQTFATIFWLYALSWATSCSGNDIKNSNNEDYQPDSTEVLKFPEMGPDSAIPLNDFRNITKDTEKQISLCLETDSPESFTSREVLESVKDPENTVLELPLSQLFKKYWNRVHPLVVKWVNKDFRALLWKDWIENLSDSIPQKLSPRAEEITSDTKYEIWDTLRFPLINPLLQWAFPQKLSEQLKEDWFQTFSDPEASEIEKRVLEGLTDWDSSEKTDFIYDIVVKRLPSWKSALALYRDWELFMATYASVWLNSKKTVRWQHEIIKEDAYKRSINHHNAPMPYGLNFYGWYWTHQWDVTWKPASHGCVRQPGVYALVSYSLIAPFVKNKKHVDVFIDKNLYKSKK